MKISTALSVAWMVCVALFLIEPKQGKASAAAVPATAPAENQSDAGAASPETATRLAGRIRRFSPDAADLETLYLEGRLQLGSERIIFRFAWERDKHAAFSVLDAADDTLLFASIDGQLLSYDPVGAFIVSDRNRGVAPIMKATPEQLDISWHFLAADAVPKERFDIDLPSFFAQLTALRATQRGPETYELTGVVRSSAVNAVVNLKDAAVCERFEMMRNKEFVFSIDRLKVNQPLKRENVFIPSGAALARRATTKALADLSPAERERLGTFGAAALAFRRGLRVPSERKVMEESFGPVDWDGAVAKNKALSARLRQEFESASLPAATQPTTAPSAAVDQSLMLIEYAAKGMPAPERPWTVADYRKAIAAMRKLDPSHLPRKDSPKSGALFRRMVSAENLDPLIHPSRLLPLKDRLQNVDFAEVTTGLLLVYPESDNRFLAERAALACNALRVIRWTVPFEDEILHSVPKNSRTYNNLERIMEQRRSGYGEMTYQLTRWLQGSKHLDPAGRVALVDAMVEFLPAYIGVLPAENQRQIWDSLRKAWDLDRSEPVRDELKKLAAAIQKLAATQPVPAADKAVGGR